MTRRRGAPEMRWWVYKCNAKNESYQKAYGDWEDFFGSPDQSWGSAGIVPSLKQLRRGDGVVAYQTNRNELVGIARVRKGCQDADELYLKVLGRIGAKVRHLKSRSPRVRQVPAFRVGPIQTIYAISEEDVRVLLVQAGAYEVLERLGWDGEAAIALEVAAAAAPEVNGAGFGTPETNAVVEHAAINAVRRMYERQGWRVRSVEQARCGYDLSCTRRSSTEHVEVKGVSGSSPMFIITQGEISSARRDKRFVLKVALHATDPRRREIRTWSGTRFLNEFMISPIAFAAKPRRRLGRR
jgi:hypothetical protein